MRFAAAVCAAALLLVSSCSLDNGRHGAGYRVLEDKGVVDYRLDVTQKRVASGLGPAKVLPSTAVLDLEEETDGGHAYTIVVRAAHASGESSQQAAANRVVGKRIPVGLEDPRPQAPASAFSGTADVAAVDIGLLVDLFAPLLPSRNARAGQRWRVVSFPAHLRWAAPAPEFTIDNEVTKDTTFHGLSAKVVASSGLANVTFRLPLVVPAPAKGGSQTLVVNELFNLLFSDIHNPVQGFVTAIAAIPLFVMAPFLALGQAIANAFGASEQPKVPVVDLSGPMRLVGSTTIWTGDGRVLDAAGTGGMTLQGQIPQLGGRAAPLSGRQLRLDATWTYTRRHTSPLPEPPAARPWLLVASAVAALIAAALTSWRVGSRGSRRTRDR